MWSWRYEGVGKEMGSSAGRQFVISLAASLAILLGGIFWTYRVGADCNKIYHHLAHAQDTLDGLRQIASIPAKGARQ